MAQHPLQPLVRDEHGVVRFKQNAIIDWLFRTGQLDLNRIAIEVQQQGWQEEAQQLVQLLGYSLSGYGDLSYVTDEAYERAAAQGVDPGRDLLEF